jgi:O-antigen ligase
LMELLTPIAFALVFSRGMKRFEQVMWMTGGMLMAATIFLSGSRGGMTAFVIQLLFFAGLIVFRTSRRMLLPVVGTIAAIAAFVLWVDDGRVLRQVAGMREPLSNVALISRYDIAKDLPRMWRDRPLLGWGLGTFPIMYPHYKSYATDVVVNQAHNDYLQALVETGIAGFACVVWFIAGLYRSAVQNLRAGFEATTSRVLGPVVGCTGILIHSLFDFNLHIPANAAMFFVLCGIATQTTSSEH